MRWCLLPQCNDWERIWEHITFSLSWYYLGMRWWLVVVTLVSLPQWLRFFTSLFFVSAVQTDSGHDMRWRGQNYSEIQLLVQLLIVGIIGVVSSACLGNLWRTFAISYHSVHMNDCLFCDVLPTKFGRATKQNIRRSQGWDKTRRDKDTGSVFVFVRKDRKATQFLLYPILIRRVKRTKLFMISCSVTRSVISGDTLEF